MPAEPTSGVVWTREMNERLMVRQRRAMRKGVWVFVVGMLVLGLALAQELPSGPEWPLLIVASVLGVAFLMQWRQERKVVPPVPEGVVVRSTFDEAGVEFVSSDGHQVRTPWAEVDHLVHDPRVRLTHWRLGGSGSSFFMPEEVFPADEVRAAQPRIARH